jgi:hypothetical protein
MSAVYLYKMPKERITERGILKKESLKMGIESKNGNEPVEWK